MLFGRTYYLYMVISLEKDKVLGTSKVQPNNRITIVRQVQKKLNVHVGDVLMYIEDENGNIVIKKGQLKPV